MVKKSVIISASIFSRSGYGDHARSITKAVIESNMFEVKILPTAWGTTPNTALDINNPDHKIFFDRIINYQLTESDKPDIFICVSIPPGFQQFGRFNIGITAGIECTKMKPEWIEHSNKMDLIITTSRFSAEVFKINKFERRNEQTKQVVGSLELTTPIEVLFEGIDPNVFVKSKPIERSIIDVFRELPTFNFLFFGHWLDGNLGHDRKDVGMLVKTFLETFKRKPKAKQPGLILKTGLAGFSITEREIIIEKIDSIVNEIRASGWTRDLPPIFVLHGNLSESEVNSLYNHPKVSAMVSFTHGEGFGRPLLEFTTTGKPVIASNWSGQIDFLHPEFALLLPGQLIPVDRSAQNEWILDGQWFQVNYQFASNILLRCQSEYEKILVRSRKHRKFTLDNFTQLHMQEKLISILEHYTSNISTPTKISLPSLKKIM